MTLVGIVQTLVGFLLVIVIIVGIHELGHYWVARLCGVRVLVYAIGFGKPLWQRIDKHGTQWRICSIPLGGYVLMVNNPEDAAKLNEPPERSLEGIPVWQRACVVFAGPLANFMLSFVLFYCIAVIGEEGIIARIGRVIPDSAAAQAGFVSGDEIIAIDNSETLHWNKVVEQLIYALGDHDAQVKVRAASGVERTLALPTNGADAGKLLDAPGPVVNLGFVLDTSFITLQVDRVIEKTPAAQAGFIEGDEVLAADGVVMEEWAMFVNRIARAKGREMELIVARNGGMVTLLATPSAHYDERVTTGYLGISPYFDKALYQQMIVRQRTGLVASFPKAWQRLVASIASTSRLMGLMFTRGVSTKNLSGPVGIARMSGDAISQGLVPYILFIALLSLSLGVINLLPIPPLDGGHLLRYSIEGIIRRPLPTKIINGAGAIGLCLLLTLMLFTVYNDLL